MKKFLLLLIIVAAAFNASADDNYFTIEGAENDTLLINPSYLGHVINFSVIAHFDGRVDQWTVTVTYPDHHPNPNNISVISVAPSFGMYLPFVTSNGNDSVYVAPLSVTSDNSTISSIVTKFGYWDHNNDGIYEPYGTIKWEEGIHDKMFNIYCMLDADCTGDSICFDSYVDCTYDWRGDMTYGMGFKKIFLKVGYKLGDVNGDGNVNIQDVAALQGYLLNNVDLDQYQLDAADLNRDGNVNIQDAAELINILLQNGEIHSLDELADI